MKKKVLSMLLVGAMMASMLVGCGGTKTEESASDDAAAETETAEEDKAESESSGSKGTITVITMALNSDYWHAVQAGAILAGQDYGYEINVIGPADETMAQEQCNQISDAVAAGADAIVISPNVPDAVQTTAQEAHKQVPLVAIDATFPDDSTYDAFLGTENYDAAYAMGEYISETYQDSQVAIIRGIVGAPTHDLRANGLKDALAEEGNEVVDVQPADSDRAKAVTVAENYLQKYPDLKVIYCTNDEMALGAYEAVKAANKTDEIAVYGFDGSVGALESIIAGELAGSMAQDPVQEGYGGVELAVKILEGESFEKQNGNNFGVVTAENAQEVLDELNENLTKAGF